MVIWMQATIWGSVAWPQWGHSVPCDAEDQAKKGKQKKTPLHFIVKRSTYTYVLNSRQHHLTKTDTLFGVHSIDFRLKEPKIFFDMLEWVSDTIRCLIITYIGEHFNKQGHSSNDMLPTVIEQVFPFNNHLRQRREKLWINKYEAVQFGANKKSWKTKC